MRLHGAVARLHMRRQEQGDRRRLLAFLAAAFQSQTHGVGVRHIAVNGVADGGVELARPILLQQADQGGGDCKNRSKPAPDFGRNRQVISAESGT
jgi:hypothetical protein